MRTALLLAMITVSEATIGVFVKLVDGRIPIATLIIGALIATQISVFNYAMTLAPIANVVIFWGVAPFFSFLFAWVFLGERPRRSYAAIFVLALVGIVIAKPLAGGHVVGNLVALADAAIYAAMVTYLRHEGRTESDYDIPWQMMVAALVLAPSLLLAGPGEPLATIAYPALGVELPVLLWAAGLGIVSTGVAYLGIAMVLRRIRADTYTLVDVIVSPVVAATFGWLVFGEEPGSGMIVGGAILLASGAWLSREMARRRAEAGAG